MTASADAALYIAPSDAMRFLANWFSACPEDQLAEVRPLHRAKDAKPCARKFFKSVDEVFNYLGDCVRNRDDVYLGALPRKCRGGTAADVGARRWLWADVDYGTIGHSAPSSYATRDEALGAIAAVGIEPTMTVDTGGGFHVWYALAVEPLAGEWTDAIARLACAVGGDTNAIDGPRILRLPGTFNFKVAPPRPIVLVSASDVAHPTEKFLRLPTPPAAPLPLLERTAPSEQSTARPRGTRPFDRANETPIADVVAWLGVAMHREGARIYCACPVHGGTNPSQMIVGGGKNAAFCFGDCQKSYSPVDLVAGARRISPKDAVNALASQFGFEGFSNVVELGRRTPAKTESESAETEEPTPVQEPKDDGDKSRSIWGRRSFYRGDQLEVARATLDTIGTGPLTYDEGEFCRYNAVTGIWDRIDIDTVSFAASTFAGSAVGQDKPRLLLISDSFLRGVVQLARMLLLNAPSPMRFTRTRPGVAFSNGFVAVEHGRIELVAHAPEHMCRYAYPFPFDADASTARLDAFLNELFADVKSAEEAEGRKALLQEFAGACLTGVATKYQKLLVLYGSGNNGKSELLRLLRGLFPPWAVASVPPQEWGERFKAARLVGILANFVDEIPERDIATGEVFKSVVTGDPVSTERKNRDPFEYRPVAGHILSANSLPGTVDQSEGYWRRFSMCPCTRDFSTAKERKIDAANDVLDAELPGLAVWALRGAARLQERGSYATTHDATEMLAEWRNDADPVRRFLVDRKDKPGIELGASALYEFWKVWARSNGFADMSSTRFGRRVMSTGLYAREDRRTGRVYSRKQAVS